MTRQAAVLIPFYRDTAGALRLVLIKRTDRGRHAGQIALPGGNVEPGDADRRATAVREASEELGVAPARFTVHEALPAMRTRTTGYEVSPFVATVTPGGWHPQPSEVAAILEPEVAALAATVGEEEVAPGYRTPVRYLDGELLWGLTYRILDPVLPRALSGDWPL